MTELGSRKQETGSRPEGESAPEGFRRLIAWQKADDLAWAVYTSLKSAKDVDPWLRNQANRAAFSVPANIAEGYGRGSLGDYLHFLDIAKGSLAELDYCLHFVRRLDLVPGSLLDELQARQKETGRVLQGLWRSLKQKNSRDWDHTAVRDERALYVADAEEDIE